MNFLNRWIAFWLLVAGLVLASIIGAFVPGQWDATANRMFTLTDGSRGLLEDIREPITLRYYFSRTAEGAPIQFKNYAERVGDLLRQYESASGGMVHLEIIDPRPDTPEEEAAIRSGLTGQPLPTGETAFFGLVAIQADQEEVIPMFTLDRERFLEFDISQLIHRVQQLEKPALGIVTSLPMFDGAAGAGNDWAAIAELREFFDVREIRDEGLPEDLDVLAVIHPGELSEHLLFEIDQFILAGGPAFIAVDPVSHVQRMEAGQEAVMGMENDPLSSELSSLFEAWGVAFDPGRVVGDLAFAAMIDTGGGARVRYPIWLRIEEFNEEAPPAAQLNEVLFAEAGSFAVEEGAEVELLPLISTSGRSGTIPTSMISLGDPEQIARQIQPDETPEIVAGILRGRLATAFPDGPPAPAANGESAEGSSATAAAMLTESPGKVSVILVGDSDFLADDFSVQRVGYDVSQGRAPINDNLAFLSNALEYLAGSEELIGLRGRGTVVRPFERVRAMEQAAYERYEEQLEILEERLREIQEELRALQAEQREQGELVASAEEQAAIEAFRAEEADMRAERREIRKKLREDIERMNLRLAVFNLFTVPALVAAFGIVFFVFRNARTRRFKLEK